MSRSFITIAGKEYDASIDEERVSFDGLSSTLEIHQAGEDTYSVLIGGRSVTVVASKGGDGLNLLVNGKQCSARVTSERDRLLTVVGGKQTTGDRLLEIRAPMPALVAAIQVEVGQDVKSGQGVIILEAMKMENEIKSHHQGRVKQIYVRKRQPVDKGDLLLILE